MVSSAELCGDVNEFVDKASADFKVDSWSVNAIFVCLKFSRHSDVGEWSVNDSLLTGWIDVFVTLDVMKEVDCNEVFDSVEVSGNSTVERSVVNCGVIDGDAVPNCIDKGSGDPGPPSIGDSAEAGGNAVGLAGVIFGDSEIEEWSLTNSADSVCVDNISIDSDDGEWSGSDSGEVDGDVLSSVVDECLDFDELSLDNSAEETGDAVIDFFDEVSEYSDVDDWYLDDCWEVSAASVKDFLDEVSEALNIDEWSLDDSDTAANNPVANFVVVSGDSIVECSVLASEVVGGDADFAEDIFSDSYVEGWSVDDFAEVSGKIFIDVDDSGDSTVDASGEVEIDALNNRVKVFVVSYVNEWSVDSSVEVHGNVVIVCADKVSANSDADM